MKSSTAALVLLLLLASGSAYIYLGVTAEAPETEEKTYTELTSSIHGPPYQVQGEGTLSWRGEEWEAVQIDPEDWVTETGAFLQVEHQETGQIDGWKKNMDGWQGVLQAEGTPTLLKQADRRQAFVTEGGLKEPELPGDRAFSWGEAGYPTPPEHWEEMEERAVYELTGAEETWKVLQFATSQQGRGYFHEVFWKTAEDVPTYIEGVSTFYQGAWVNQSFQLTFYDEPPYWPVEAFEAVEEAWQEKRDEEAVMVY